MNILTILIDAGTLLICALAVSGCGADTGVLPTPELTPAPIESIPAVEATPIPIAIATPTSTPTATATPNPTVVTYIFQNINICTDLHTWDPQVTTIKTYSTASNGPIYYLLRWDGVFIVDPSSCPAGCAVNNLTLTRSDIHGVVCTITVSGGVYQGVTP